MLRLKRLPLQGNIWENSQSTALRHKFLSSLQAVRWNGWDGLLKQKSFFGNRVFAVGYLFLQKDNHILCIPVLTVYADDDKTTTGFQNYL